jgi:hypothetical protein
MSTLDTSFFFIINFFNFKILTGLNHNQINFFNENLFKMSLLFLTKGFNNQQLTHNFI